MVLPSNMEVLTRPFPGPQTWALRCPITEICFGGARGGGKSRWLILDWLDHAAECDGRARGLVLRRTRTQLADFLEECQTIMPKLGWHFNKTEHQWRHSDGSVLTLAYLEREKDAEEYQGWNLSWLGIDEAGNFATPAGIDKLRATLRLPGLKCRLRLTANPGGVGHEWLKERYVSAARPMTPIRRTITLPSGEQIPTISVFIPSRLKDNPAANTPNYRAQLAQSGPSWLVKAWLEGDWDVQPAGGIIDPDMIQEADPPCLVELAGRGEDQHGRARIEYLQQGWDTAFTTKTQNDESACATGGRDDARRYWLLNVHAGRWNVPEVARQVMEQQRLWKARKVWAEGGPAGLAIEPTVNELRHHQCATFGFELCSHMTDKVTKNAGFAAAVGMGLVWRPKGAVWWPRLRDQCLVFSGKDGIPDDLVDACGVLFRHIDLMPGAATLAAPPRRPAERTKEWFEDRAQIAKTHSRPQTGPRRMFS